MFSSVVHLLTSTLPPQIQRESGGRSAYRNKDGNVGYIQYSLILSNLYISSFKARKLQKWLLPNWKPKSVFQPGLGGVETCKSSLLSVWRSETHSLPGLMCCYLIPSDDTAIWAQKQTALFHCVALPVIATCTFDSCKSISIPGVLEQIKVKQGAKTGSLK